MSKSLSRRPTLEDLMMLHRILLAMSFLSVAPVVAQLELRDVAGELGVSLPVTAGASFLDGMTKALLQRNIGHGAAVGDYDRDGDLDVYLLAPLGEPNRLLRNQLAETGSARFVDATAPPLDDHGLSRTAHFVDLNNDGLRDLVLINDDEGTPDALPSRLFRNDGNGFTDVTEDSGFRPNGYLRTNCALADYDGDGLLDIYVTVWTFHATIGPSRFPGSNRLYRNLGDFRFEDVTAEVGLGGLRRDSYTAIFTDFGGTHHPEVFVAVDHTSDFFYAHTGSGFVDVTDLSGANHVGTDMGVAPGDFDNDGDLDMFVTNVTDPSGRFGPGAGNTFYVQTDVIDGIPRFANRAAEHGVFDTFWGWGTEMVDLDNDGDLDIVAVTGFDEFVREFDSVASPVYQTPSVLLRNDGTGQFARHSGTGLDAPADSRGLVAFDVDRDGDQDLLVTNVGQPIQLFRTSGVAGHWLDVDLRPDRLAIGASVYATADGVVRRRDIVAGRSFLVGTPQEAHFGLGASASVDVLRVVWADGSETVRKDVAADQLLVIDAPGTPVELLTFTIE